ncbi:MAG: hypothetical protein ABII02_01180 [Candidatus Magasanikbacteria bacterium]
MFIFDLDYTLYRTDLVVRDMKQIFLGFGIDESLFLSSYRETINWSGKGYGFDYSFEKHITFLQKLGIIINMKDSVKKLETCIKKEYLCEDAISFLQFLKIYDDPIVLLTAGNPDFQKMKVKKIGLEAYIDHAYYLHGNKDLFIRDMLDHEKRIIFINDNHKENAMVQEISDAVVVIGKRNPIKYFVEGQGVGNIPYFDTLKEIELYVRERI